MRAATLTPGRLHVRAWQRRLAMISWLALTVAIHLPATSLGASYEPAMATKGTITIPDTVLQRLDEGKPQELLILLDAGQIEAEADNRRRRAGLEHDDETILNFKSDSYRQLKEKAIYGPAGDAQAIRDYSHLPMLLLRFPNRQTLARVLARTEVVAVYENKVIYPDLTISLPFIGEPATAGLGFTGNGVTVAVIDTGINYTLPAFGSCTAPGVPAGCKVCASVDVTGNNLTLNTDPNNHGTNVAGIVAGVAPGSSIAAVNAFSGGSSTTDLVIAGINWAIANKSAYNVVALNMSLGDGSDYTSPCNNSHTNPFLTPINNAIAAGIEPVAAAGNSAFTNGISSPACTPGVVSVGAVYDANWGGPYNWGVCTDAAASAPDTIPCFSNSAPFLTLLAPGVFITAAGIQMAGTSQATPHVAGAWAVLKSGNPTATQSQLLNALLTGGKPVTDPRNGVTKPRVQLDQALYLLDPPLTVSRGGGGSGTVTSAPAGISCGAACSALFAAGTSVTLNATPDSGSSFAGWSGACSGAGSCTVTINAAANVTATFALTPVNGACGSANGQALNTTPTANLCSAGTASQVSGTGPWSWSCAGLYGGSTVACSAPITSFTITTAVTNGAGGTVTATASTVPYGGGASFTINPDPGFILTLLTDNGFNVNPTANPDGTYTYSINNVTANHAVTAAFAPTPPATVPAMQPFTLSVALLLMAVLGSNLRLKRKRNCSLH